MWRRGFEWKTFQTLEWNKWVICSNRRNTWQRDSVQYKRKSGFDRPRICDSVIISSLETLIMSLAMRLICKERGQCDAKCLPTSVKYVQMAPKHRDAVCLAAQSGVHFTLCQFYGVHKVSLCLIGGHNDAHSFCEFASVYYQCCSHSNGLNKYSHLKYHSLHGPLGDTGSALIGLPVLSAEHTHTHYLWVFSPITISFNFEHAFHESTQRDIENSKQIGNKWIWYYTSSQTQQTKCCFSTTNLSHLQCVTG